MLKIYSKIQGVLLEKVPQRQIGIEQKKEFERATALLFRDKIEKLLRKLQSLNSDPVLFGEKYRIANPLKWKANDWRRIYPTARINVRTEFTLKETGLFR